MKKNLQISYLVAFLGMCITFFGSLVHNPWTVSFVRSLICFALFFIICFLASILLSSLLDSEESVQGKTDSDEHLGQNIHLETPDDLGLPSENQGTGQQEQMDDAFVPLNPPQFRSKEADPEEMAKAVRHLSNSDE